MDRECLPINDAIHKALDILPASCRPIATHILDAGGKRLRPLLTVLCARSLGRRDDSIYLLGASMEFLHAATLLHDDVLDNALSRRGAAAAHTLFGETRAILAGDAMLALGNTIVASFAMPALSLCYSEATMRTAAGEILEIDSIRQPELDHDSYLEIARGKTACLIANACAIGAIAADGPNDAINACLDYGENLGLAFQIVDDALDFAPESQTGKPCGGDLREGKMTPPIRIYRESLGMAEKEVFDSLFRNEKPDENDLAAVARSISEYTEKARELARIHLEAAKLALMTLPASHERNILTAIADYIGNRAR